MPIDPSGLYYEEKGSGETVVLLHGFTLDTRMWDDQFDLLSEKYRVIRFDHRGHGRSAGVTKRYSQTKDVKALLDSIQVESAHLVGLSMGGMVSINFAVAYPDRVRSLVLVDSGGSFDPTSEFGGRLVTYLTTGATQGLEAGLKLWSADPILEPAHRIPSVAERLKEIVLKGHLAQGEGAFFLNGTKPIPSAVPLEERLSEIAAPTLVIVGEHDLPEFLEISERYGSDIPNARKVVISSAGHMSNMESPEAFNSALMGFLSSQT